MGVQIATHKIGCLLPDSSPHSAVSELAAVAKTGGQLEVELHKGAVGLGFCIEGGKGSPLGDRPITVKRLFKGTMKNAEV